MPSLIQRLKNKKVVQWALGYLAGAFVVLQLMDALEGALNLSRQAQQGILGLLACGLVVTVIVAWFHGDKGQQRIRLAEIIAVGVTLVLGISASAMLWIGTGNHSTPGTSVEPTSGSVLSSSPEAGETASPSVADTPPSSPGGEQEGLVTSDTASRAQTEERLPASEPASAAPDDEPTGTRRPTIQQTALPTLSPDNPTLFAGDSVRLELDTDQPAIWTSSDRSVAMVTTDGLDGLALAMGPGSARITATVGEAEVSTLLTVRAVIATEVEIAPVGPMRPGESVRPEVTVETSNGHTQGRAGLQWSSSDSSVIAIGNRGTLNAVSPGSARISAGRDGVTGSIDVTVEAGPEGQPPTQPVSADILLPVLDRYRAALQDLDMDGVIAVYPDISAEERAGWETLFRLGKLSVEFSGLTVLAASSTTAEVEFEQTLSGDRIERNLTRFVASLALADEGWRIRQLRAVGTDL